MDLVATRNEAAHDVDPAGLVEVEALDGRLGEQPLSIATHCRGPSAAD